MRITRLRLQSWRNFRELDIPLQRRAFLVGPNASGKSNLLDALRFLREVAEPEGGFQRAVGERGGVSQLRSFHAPQKANVLVEIEIELSGVHWLYRLEFTQNRAHQPVVQSEQVERDGVRLLDRPDAEDREDSDRLSQTHLEQVNANKSFREVAELLSQVRYLHIVPQLIRDVHVSPRVGDPFGSDFLERLVKTPKRTRDSRLQRISSALQVAVPQLAELRLERDEQGIPHLEGRFEHWRRKADWQSETHFSDGTLRLLGLLWAILDGEAPLLLEEPELSLHSEIVRHIPSMVVRSGARSKRSGGRQVVISTHSAELLRDEGIAPEEVVLLIPTSQGTEVRIAATEPQIRDLYAAGLSMADAALPFSAPPTGTRLAL